VSEAARQQVLAAVASLNYRPSRVARSLRTQRSAIIGLIIADVQNPFFTAMVRAVEDVAQQNQYAVFLCNSDEDPQKEELYIDLMRSEQVSGVVIVPTQETNSPAGMLTEANIPIVSVDRRMTDIAVDTVLVDNAWGAAELVSHLIEAGHRRIGAVLGPQHITTARERKDGYLQALARHGLEVDEELICAGQFSSESGFEMALRLLDLNERPTAIFSGDNLNSTGVMKAIRQRGLRVPRDLAFACFDELEWMTLLGIEHVSAAQPIYQLGKTAAELLLNRMDEPDCPPREVVLRPDIRFNPSGE
jgi:DNA-binding LacI/PurR family transcriptional regulator